MHRPVTDLAVLQQKPLQDQLAQQLTGHTCAYDVTTHNTAPHSIAQGSWTSWERGLHGLETKDRQACTQLLILSMCSQVCVMTNT
jgi:hypothetical protein